MDPNVWEEPERYRPDRFLDEFGNVVGKELIMPFSVGAYQHVFAYSVHVPCLKECLNFVSGPLVNLH